MSPLRISHAGDAALLVELGARIDPVTNARAVALARGIREQALPLLDAVVGFASVTLYFDPLAVEAEAIADAVRKLEPGLEGASADDGRLIHVPVAYGGVHGPDLREVAAAARLSEADVVDLHASVTYRVYMLGFVPGFAYMASVDPRLSLPRRATPRPRVPAGSVAIAAGQTGIYPLDTPGGWHLIGRTTIRPFDPEGGEPFLFRPGDRVRFEPVHA